MANQKPQVPPEYEEVPTSDESEIITHDEALAKIALILAKTDNKKMLSEISDYEAKSFASLYSVASRTNNTMLQAFLDHMLELRVSLRRKGREELMSVAKASRTQDDMQLKIKKMFSGWR